MNNKLKIAVISCICALTGLSICVISSCRESHQPIYIKIYIKNTTDKTLQMQYFDECQFKIRKIIIPSSNKTLCFQRESEFEYTRNSVDDYIEDRGFLLQFLQCIDTVTFTEFSKNKVLLSYNCKADTTTSNKSFYKQSDWNVVKKYKTDSHNDQHLWLDYTFTITDADFKLNKKVVLTE